jgi:SNF2 family DNA or RNA helicase
MDDCSKPTLTIGCRGNVVLERCAGSKPRAIALRWRSSASDSDSQACIHERWQHSAAAELLRMDVLARACIERSPMAAFGFGPVGQLGAHGPRAGDLVLPTIAQVAEPHVLYEFQRQGVAWLRMNPRSILADDMGLGKTIQVICALKALCAEKFGFRALIVAPVTLMDNWIRELSHWAPLLVVRKAREVEAHRRNALHVLLASYEDVVSDSALAVEWDAIVADEAHHLRKGDAMRSRAFARLRAKHLWLLSGTPIENRPNDFAELLGLLAPGKLSPTRLGRDTDRIRSAAKPFTLRRTKDSVLADLPPLNIRDVAVQLTPSQSREYARVETDSDRQRRHPFARVRELQQICDFWDQHSGKVEWMQRFCGSLPLEEKVIAFSSYLPVLELARSCLRSSELLSGAVAPEVRSHIVDRFQLEPSPRVLLLSQRVGAEGITLTRANHVVFINEWWNPSATAQAIDRVRRIGQHREVFCYRLYVPDSIEDRVRRLLNEKTEQAKAVLDALSNGGD